MKIPAKYRILPFIIDVDLPDFRYVFRKFDVKALSPDNIKAEVWFDEFAKTVVGSIGKQYFPVCRIADGEYKFLFGEPRFNLRYSLLKNVCLFTRQKIRYLLRGKDFFAATRINVSSGRYSYTEQVHARERYSKMLREISEFGFLALYLHFKSEPFAEHYYPKLSNWLRENCLHLRRDNYIPFYFVYALVSGRHGHSLFLNRRVLLVTSYDEEKQRIIENTMRSKGALAIYWIKISPERSLFDTINTDDLQGKIDIAFVGAGVGKPNIILQLKKLNVPCIDAGYIFEVWRNPEIAEFRAFCLPDGKLSNL